MDTYRLRLLHRNATEFELGPGVHALGVDRAGLPTVVEDAHEAIARISVDHRGLWLRIREDVRGLHVNGRPVRRVAHLRGGDCVFVEGEGMTVLGRRPDAPPRGARTIAADGVRLRSVGGEHHGRCFALGAAVEGQPAWPEADVRLAAVEGGIVLDAARTEGVQVNGHAVHRALLRTGDQIVVDGRRYVVEGHLDAGPARAAPADVPARVEPAPRHSGARRVPWLLLAALLMALALAGLLLYGGR